MRFEKPIKLIIGKIHNDGNIETDKNGDTFLRVSCKYSGKRYSVKYDKEYIQKELYPNVYIFGSIERLTNLASEFVEKVKLANENKELPKEQRKIVYPVLSLFAYEYELINFYMATQKKIISKFYITEWSLKKRKGTYLEGQKPTVNNYTSVRDPKLLKALIESLAKSNERLVQENAAMKLKLNQIGGLYEGAKKSIKKKKDKYEKNSKGKVKMTSSLERENLEEKEEKKKRVKNPIVEEVEEVKEKETLPVDEEIVENVEELNESINEVEDSSFLDDDLEEDDE